MHHASTEWIWVEIAGPEDWSTRPVFMSIDAGDTWADAEADTTTTRTVTLPNGLVGEATWIRALSSDLGEFTANTTVPVIVRISADVEIPVLSAGSIAVT